MKKLQIEESLRSPTSSPSMMILDAPDEFIDVPITRSRQNTSTLLPEKSYLDKPKAETRQRNQDPSQYEQKFSSFKDSKLSTLRGKHVSEHKEEICRCAVF
eukprot:CAMPEP_0204914434 /NCGR_PEP_ID=MMETSP1397-20131031/12306_1 /ASSEMBLY_ACC=CAM_ASM_000891 /TAXON_ID=49980 /ORGANISM="Climacostomum Climacostomum virens, Strain Stock W-24" /LENGTH=100 /DNA_ID=CAMNT_0052086005 /DNA_START=289 /DNA_END=591 /DNA_ORIENTATION=+